jgi:hypothetical protein
VTVTVFLLALGATARLTMLLTDDYIARNIRAWFIRRFGPEHDLAYLVTCPWCFGMWVAAAVLPLAWFYGDRLWFIIPALVLTVSWLVGAAATFVNATQED